MVTPYANNIEDTTMAQIIKKIEIWRNEAFCLSLAEHKTGVVQLGPKNIEECGCKTMKTIPNMLRKEEFQNRVPALTLSSLL